MRPVIPIGLFMAMDYATLVIGRNGMKKIQIRCHDIKGKVY